MHVETGLIVVGSADSHLRVSKRKKRLEGITQTMVDRNLMEEIRTFLVGILTNTGRKVFFVRFIVMRHF